MGKLSNHYDKCTLLNLGYGPNGRGPFLIRQEGYPAGSETFKEERYLLRKDGTWVINVAVFTLSDKDKEQFFYDSASEVIALLQGLGRDPVVEDQLPADMSPEELERAAQSTITGLWGRIRAAKPSKLEP